MKKDKNIITENEIIQRFHLLTKYDTEKTLNENKILFTEQTPAALTGAATAATLGGNDTTTENPSVIYNPKYIDYYARVLGRNLNYAQGRLVNPLGGPTFSNLRRVRNVLIKKIVPLKMENGESAVTALIRRYAEFGWGDVIEDVKSVKVRTQKGVDMRNEVLNLLSQGISDVEKPAGVATGSTPTYHNCTAFPFTLGCKNAAIKEIQVCLGIKADGAYGPITDKALKDKGYDTSGGITQDIYNKIKQSCNQQNNGLSTVQAEISRGSLKYAKLMGIGPLYFMNRQNMSNNETIRIIDQYLSSIGFNRIADQRLSNYAGGDGSIIWATNDMVQQIKTAFDSGMKRETITRAEPFKGNITGNQPQPGLANKINPRKQV